MPALKLPLRSLLCLSMTLLWLSPALAGPGEGQGLYDSYCQVCHGGLGEGQTMGKPLTDLQAKNLSDEQLLTVISNGRSGTGMAAWGGSLSEQEIHDIAGYIRVLQGGSGLSSGTTMKTDANDPAVIAGAQLFQQLGCATCHSYKDQGGNIGPALDGVSTHMPQAALVHALADPSARITEGYEVKIVELPDGSVIRGRFRNESDLALQIQSADGSRWVTYFKARVKSITDSDESLMPSRFNDLSEEQQNNLLAFLKSL